MPERKQTRVTNDDDDDDASDAGDAEVAAAPMCWTTPGLCRPAALATTRTPRRYDVDDAGHRKLRMSAARSSTAWPGGTAKRAPATTRRRCRRCLVKYALKELLQGKTADDILTLSVCEPAMGSAAFLNEAINQLAENIWS